MSNYGQQPPYGQNPYGQPASPYGQPQQPYGQPSQPPYGQPQNPYGGQPNPYGPPQQAPQPGQYPAQPGHPGQPPAPPRPGGNPYGQQPPPGQWSPPEAARKPEMVKRSIVVVTLDSVPGREVAGVLGDVLGVVARSRELPRELRTGSQIDGYVTMLTQSRQDAVKAMVEMAEAAGADAVLGLRFDSSEITQSLSEISAYGTAVTLSAAPNGESSSPQESEADPDSGRAGFSGATRDPGLPSDAGPTPDHQESVGQGATPGETQPGQRSPDEVVEPLSPPDWDSGTPQIDQPAPAAGDNAAPRPGDTPEPRPGQQWPPAQWPAQG